MQTVSREYTQQLEIAIFSFVFVSRRSFILAINRPDCFSLELYAIAPERDPKAETPRAVHVATYLFPRLQPGCTCTGSFQSLAKSYSTSLALKLPPSPCPLSPASSTLQVKRAYFGSPSAHAGSVLRVCTIIPMSLFMATEHRYFEAAKAWRWAGGQSVDLPSVYQWDEWGPDNTRAFSHSTDEILASHGSRLLLYKDRLLDFNVWSVARDLHHGQQEKVAQTTGSSALYRAAFKSLRRASRVIGIKQQPENQEDHSDASSFTRLIREPNLIPHDNIFTESIVTKLPYVEKPLQWNRPQHNPIYGGEVWVTSSSWNVRLFIQPGSRNVLLTGLRLTATNNHVRRRARLHTGRSVG